MNVTELPEPARTRAEHRLRHQQTAWLTTVRPNGQPQSSPVGYLWDGTGFLVITQPRAAKVRNLRANPRVALHLELDETATDDGGVLSIEGTATVEPGPPPAAEAAAYVARYREEIDSQGLTAEAVFADYSTVIRVTPTRVRSY
jgi:PPOX class probable F420-dependent enzyme